MIEKSKWILCPICKLKTRIKVYMDTILINFPLYCPKCKKESFVNIRKLKITVIKEPDAKTQSQ
ncbi:conjugal transfer protein [Oceanobacillus oncorhynchi subsp. incaldanensis]|uniref:cysteine-rich KTR domain-containing protein n=1 Tax=Oceanobacillus oncorhynchi TaxID=545501 RepID=UPI001B150BA1|nr:cysteine-rich KTR domain-containing protein [Oceanobacillus oncorhynchi]GIO19363.1 conjugal transfer protein [Oceanobacillus oncorhynchi subsp. incaldanensis]